ncbi:CAP domain-containing protein [Rhizobium alvei]|uniref:CAP domain-containing protein n=1 Tax=Rhizobium alvei TaxID=1132659 RepID=A0ABT8YJ16_9HYPH|nr:CAP domain-containing protein [Rhizobium alvei]MDO6963235.1 CAP domain-containing protein [Rhizobium alvei]
MANLSAQEQLMLELTNRARMDPVGEARRMGLSNLNEGVAAADRISSAPKQVLAGNDDLAQAAARHSSWMLAHDIFDHSETSGTSGFTGKNPSDRMTNAGYTFSGSFTAGENIAVRGTTTQINAKDLTQMIIAQHKDLFVDENIDGRGHRLNILEDAYREIGIGQESGKFAFESGGTQFNSSMVTQDFARSGTSLFVTGVVYKDNVINNDFFSVGEQIAGRKVSGGGLSDTTGSGGGYELAMANGNARSILFDLANGDVTVGLQTFVTNIKVDVVNGNEVWTNGELAFVSGNVRQVHALGIAAIDLAGGTNGQTLTGNDAANRIDGKAGNDVLIGGLSVDVLVGGSGADQFRFDDRHSGKTNSTADRITDFTGADTINMELVDANSKKAGDQDFSFIGGEAFHHKAGELRAFSSGGDTFIQGDTNGDGSVDFLLRLDGRHAMTAGDFDL